MDEQPSKFDPRSGKPRKSLAQVLARYTVSPTGCWEWTGARNQLGYGIVGLMLDGKINTMPAHRLQWMRLNGEPTEGMDICHRCDNRGCINPAHLFEGTPRDNIRDMISKGRDVRLRGEDHPHTTLTTAQILSIRADPRKGPAIAADYGVSATTVYNIKRGHTWGHVGFLKVLS